MNKYIRVIILVGLIALFTASAYARECKLCSNPDSYDGHRSYVNKIYSSSDDATIREDKQYITRTGQHSPYVQDCIARMKAAEAAELERLKKQEETAFKFIAMPLLVGSLFVTYVLPVIGFFVILAFLRKVWRKLSR